MALSHCHKPVLWSKWPLASSLLQAIKTCRQACQPSYLMHFSKGWIPESLVNNNSKLTKLFNICWNHVLFILFRLVAMIYWHQCDKVLSADSIVVHEIKSIYFQSSVFTIFFMKTMSLSPNLSKLAPADISWRTLFLLNEKTLFQKWMYFRTILVTKFNFVLSSVHFVPKVLIVWIQFRPHNARVYEGRRVRL